MRYFVRTTYLTKRKISSKNDELVKISQESKINEISNPFNLYRVQVKEEVGNEVDLVIEKIYVQLMMYDDTLFVCWSEVICFS